MLIYSLFNSVFCALGVAAIAFSIWAGIESYGMENYGLAVMGVLVFPVFIVTMIKLVDDACSDMRASKRQFHLR